MAILKCPICGGELDLNSDMSVGVCKFCDSTITIPKNLEKKENLYNRAVFFRQGNEFDKAIEAYEALLNEDSTDAEAHWGLVLSKFGIEYVKDPVSGERKPTCHRLQYKSILSDIDYLAALENADPYAKEVYEKEAVRINEIQNKVLEISKKEPPYDIFICYKELDSLGNRTNDSVLAQEIYNELVKKGYKVFFARKTLESKLGKEYEPVIFAALNSAKVMLVVATSAENVNAVWVKNEWSRFLMLSKDNDKTIIPAYKNMSPYELPAELAGFQAQDMSKIGFMQDLIDGIDKILKHSNSTFKPANGDYSAKYNTGNLEKLVKNAETYLNLDNYSEAEAVYRTITKDYPEDYRGWWGLIVCRTKKFNVNINDFNQIKVWLGYIKKLASETIYEQCKNQCRTYADMLSKIDADEEIKGNQNSVKQMEKEIKKLEKAIDTINNNKNEGLNSLEIKTKELEKNIEASNKKLKKAKSKVGSVVGTIICAILTYTLWRVVGWAIHSLNSRGSEGLIQVLIVVAAGIFMLSFGMMTIVLFSGLFSKKISDYERNLIGEINAYNRAIRKLHDDFNNLRYDDEIKTKREKIDNISTNLNDLNAELAKGKDYYINKHYDKYCKTMGITENK